MAWMERVENDMEKISLQEHITLDRKKWREKIFVDDQRRLLLGSYS